MDQKCVTPAKGANSSLWTDAGTGSKLNISLWDTAEVEKTIPHGLFTAVQQANTLTKPPSSTKFWALNKQYCKVVTWDTEVDHNTDVDESFSKLFNDEKSADVVVVCEGKKIFAHKVILASRR